MVDNPKSTGILRKSRLEKAVYKPTYNSSVNKSIKSIKDCIKATSPQSE